MPFIYNLLQKGDVVSAGGWGSHQVRGHVTTDSVSFKLEEFDPEKEKKVIERKLEPHGGNVASKLLTLKYIWMQFIQDSNHVSIISEILLPHKQVTRRDLSMQFIIN